MDAINESWLLSVWAQCWQVTLLILATWLTVRFAARNRPHLACVLWLVVLIKCVTPPLWSSPSSVFSWLQASARGVEVALPAPAWELSRRVAAKGDQFDRSDVVVEILRAQPQPAEPLHDATLAPSPLLLAGWFSRRNWSSWTGALTVLWSVGCVAFASLAALRWARCWQRLRRDGAIDAPGIVRLVDQLRQRMGLRRPVRLMVSRSPVGPAVVGILRPTIILPALIVEAKTPAELEPLLAHELIHIKRGDLWVGLLQLLAQGVWWFHPLVRLANCLLTREAERCCDEEVIAHLGCDPGRYARSLIDVLALKRTLQPVPVFPGVRPVDVTSQRLERIMRLGQGCHKRTPNWCWLVMLLAVAATLPGAAFIVAEDAPVPSTPQAPPLPEELKTQIQDTARFAPAPRIPRTPDGSTLNSSPVTAISATVNHPLETRSYAVDDVIARFNKEVESSEKRAREMILNCLIHALERTIDPQTLKSVLDRKSQGREPKFEWSANSLVISATEQGHTAIAAELQKLRKSGFEQVQVEVRIITGKVANLDLFPLDLEVLDAGRGEEDIDTWNDEVKDSKQPSVRPGAEIRGRAESVIEKHRFHRMAVADPAQVRAIIDKAQSDPRTNVMYAPKVTVFNGQRASISDRVSRPFVVAHQRTAAGVSKPIIRTLHDGFIMQIRPRLLDERMELFGIELKVALSNIVDVETHTFQGNQNQPLQVQCPEVATNRITTTLELTPDKTLVIGDLSFMSNNEAQPLMLMLSVRKAKPGSSPLPPKRVAPEAISNPIQTVAGSQPYSETQDLAPLDNKIATPPRKNGKSGLDFESDAKVNANMLETRVYNVADLVIPLSDAPAIFFEPGFQSVTSNQSSQSKAATVPLAERAHLVEAAATTSHQPKVDFESLTDLITLTVCPESWVSNGGPGSMRKFEKTLSLVIRQTGAVHREIAGVLGHLRHLQDLQASYHLERVEIAPAEFEAWAETQSEPLASEIVSTLKTMPSPAIPISRSVVEKLRKAAGLTVHSAPKVTLFNAQRIEVQLANSVANSARDVAWLQLNPVISADLRLIRVNVAAGLSADDKQNPKHSELVTMPPGQSLLIDLSQRRWTNREVGVPVLNKIPYISPLFKNSSPDSASATRQFYLVTPRIILVREEAESANAVSDQK